jgi:hypothetical protein
MKPKNLDSLNVIDYIVAGNAYLQTNTTQHYIERLKDDSQKRFCIHSKKEPTERYYYSFNDKMQIIEFVGYGHIQQDGSIKAYANRKN